MRGTKVSRRTMLTGSLAALSSVVVPAAVAAPTGRKLFEGTSLAENPLAARFEVLPATVHLPEGVFQSVTGVQRFSNLKNPATLVTLWAEFCAPCLMEMPDLAQLGDRYRASGFNVIAIHVGGTPQAAKAKLATINAPSMPSWNDTQAKFVTAIATPPSASGFTLPCNFLVDHNGRVRGRAFGAQSIGSVGQVGKALTADQKRQLEHFRSAWSLPTGDQFAKTLAGGLLSHV